MYTRFAVAAWITAGAIALPAPAASGPNHDLTLPLHARLGGHTCFLIDPCDPGPPLVNVPPGEFVTVYLLFRGGTSVAGIQTAFEWPGWSYQGADWMCQDNQITGAEPSGTGGPIHGTIATAFDCVTGTGTAVVGLMGFLAGSSGCLAQIESAFPFGNHVVSCAGEVDQVPPADWGSICVESGGYNACAESTSNLPPVCDAGGDYLGPVGYPIQMDGTGSHDPDGYIEAYAWEFGDGATGQDPAPSHTYMALGTYTVTLCVRDEDLNETCCNTTATATDMNFPPDCVAGGPYSGDPGETISFNGSGSSDPDGTIISYDWEFGDGGTGAGPLTTHVYAANGIYTVTLCVTDDDLAEICCPTSATISDELFPPNCAAGGPYAGQAGFPVTFDGRASNDPDGTIVLYEWEFGDGGVGLGPLGFHTYQDSANTYLVTLCVTDDDTLQSCCNSTAVITEPPPPNDADIGFVLHALETGFGPCEIPLPCPQPTTSVEVGDNIFVYLIVDHFESLSGVQCAFSFGPFLMTFGLWNCQSNQVNGTTPTMPGGPTSGTIATAFDCITGVQTVVIGRMNMIAEGPGCVTLPQSSFPFGNHVIDCTGQVTEITAPSCLGQVCAELPGVNACGPCQSIVVEPSTWGGIKQRFRD